MEGWEASARLLASGPAIQKHRLAGKEDSCMKTLCLLTAAVCALQPLACFASVGNVNGEATWISFSVPEATQGTFPMSINASMTVTGYYIVSPTQTSGFIREADGPITLFAIPGAMLTVPESINGSGDITGFYQLSSGSPEGFLRYAGGRMFTFGIPNGEQDSSQRPPVIPTSAQPAGINDFDEIAGGYLFY